MSKFKEILEVFKFSAAVIALLYVICLVVSLAIHYESFSPNEWHKAIKILFYIYVVIMTAYSVIRTLEILGLLKYLIGKRNL
jgi:hypothetical protein